MWQLVRQGEVYVSGGTSWDVGIFRVRIGELVRDRGAGNGLEKRASVLAVGLLAVEDADGDEDGMVDGGADRPEGEFLTVFARSLGLIGDVHSVGCLTSANGSSREPSKEVALWCQVLKTLALSGAAPRPHVAE